MKLVPLRTIRRTALYLIVLGVNIFAASLDTANDPLFLWNEYFEDSHPGWSKYYERILEGLWYFKRYFLYAKDNLRN